VERETRAIRRTFRDSILKKREAGHFFGCEDGREMLSHILSAKTTYEASRRYMRLAWAMKVTS